MVGEESSQPNTEGDPNQGSARHKNGSREQWEYPKLPALWAENSKALLPAGITVTCSCLHSGSPEVSQPAWQPWKAQGLRPLRCRPTHTLPSAALTAWQKPQLEGTSQRDIMVQSALGPGSGRETALTFFQFHTRDLPVHRQC